LRIEVQDSGVGIGEDQLETIFEPFEQVGDMRRRLGGTGLGLAISRQFVQLMGGEIRVESCVGKGSTFWFELDVQVVVEGTAVPASKSKSIVTGYQGPRRKVLIVDDVAENRAVLIDMLGPLGFAMAEAVNGQEGLEQAEAMHPDLILMDVVMPKMDGLEAMRRLRQFPDFKAIPVIAISASASGGDEASSMAAGANAFLPKPIDLSRLLAQIGALLRLEWIDVLQAAPHVPEWTREERLAVPPAQEMEILHHLARLGNMQEILRRAEHLIGLDERYRPFAGQLSLLAKGYRSKAILSLVEQYQRMGQTP
jgi:CheY-like chemotaxis protein